MSLLTSSRVRQRVERLELDWNRYGVDRYGVCKDDLARFYSILGLAYRRYFDVEVYGTSNVPAHGRAVLVGNHSGGVALDGAMVLASLFFELDPPRIAHGMAEKFIERMPFGALLSNRIGHFTGLPENAERLLDDDRMLLVFPEGARGTAKLYGDRYSLVDFGTGFLRLALEKKAPIVPFAFLGGGEAIPTVVNLYRLGKRFGVPYLPVTPYLLPIPRPVDLQILYGEPMSFPGNGDEEDAVIQGWADEVKASIAELIADGRRLRQGRGEAVRA